MSRLVDAFGSPLFRRAMLEAVLVGVLAGIVGVHVVLRRLPFFVTAMSHATFPGVVIASTLGLSLFLGGAAFGLVVVAAVLVLGAERALDDTAVDRRRPRRQLRRRDDDPVDASVGVEGPVGDPRRLGAHRDPGDVAHDDRRRRRRARACSPRCTRSCVLGAFDPAGAPGAGLPGVGVLDARPARRRHADAGGRRSRPSARCWPIALLTVPALTARLWTDRLGPTMALAAGLGALQRGRSGCAPPAIWSIAAGGAIALTTGALFAVSLAATSTAGQAAVTRSHSPTRSNRWCCSVNPFAAATLPRLASRLRSTPVAG